MNLRVAHIPYLNSAPFFAGMDDAEFDLVDLDPRALGQAAEEGDIDAGLMSIADTFRSPDFVPLGDLGIALEAAAHSVLLFSARPVEELDGATVGITGETSTSYPLLRLLLAEHYDVHPSTFVRRPGGARPGDDAILLIGDAALRRAAAAGLVPGAFDYDGAILSLPDPAPGEPFPHVLDLAAAWRTWQDLPFVFARWMVRHTVERQEREHLLTVLLETLEANLRRLHEVAEAHAGRAGLDADAAFAYLMGFTYRFGGRGEEAIAAFRRRLEASPWWESVPPAVLHEGGA